MLSLVRIPHRIECFDISHSQGQEVVASLVSFLDGKPDKSNYRRFKMSIDKNDDFAQMKEAVTRRYRRLKEEGSNFPDLVLIDGGLGQLNAALESLEQLGLSHLECASIAKKEELIYRPFLPVPLRIPRTSPVLHLLQRVRDEAHRFAVTYHRSLRSKRTFKNELASIKGVGNKTVQKLIEHFGSVKQVRHASPKEIETIVGSRLSQSIQEWQRS
jgi:excinuclease ABC subunit C